MRCRTLDLAVVGFLLISECSPGFLHMALRCLHQAACRVTSTFFSILLLPSGPPSPLHRPWCLLYSVSFAGLPDRCVSQPQSCPGPSGPGGKTEAPAVSPAANQDPAQADMTCHADMICHLRSAVGAWHILCLFFR